MIKGTLIEESIIESFRIDIHIAGDISTARATCKRFVWHNHSCVTIKEQDFVYTGGLESGVCVGIVQYPKYPVSHVKLIENAQYLAQNLMIDLHETSALIVTDIDTYWLHRGVTNEQV